MNKKTHLRRPRTLKAFTLLEMIVVIAIIGILASIIVPSTVDQIRTAKIQSANTRAEELFRAVQDYCTDKQIKRAPMVRETASSPDTPAFPVVSPTQRKVGITFTVNSATNWSVETYNASPLNDADIALKCVQGISNYIGHTTVESLVGASFFIYIDVDTYTIECLLYCDQDDTSTTAVNEAQKYVNGVASSGKFYTQVFGRPSGGGKSQEFDTNQFLGGKATTTDVVPYVGQYPVPY